MAYNREKRKLGKIQVSLSISKVGDLSLYFLDLHDLKVTSCGANLSSSDSYISRGKPDMPAPQMKPRSSVS